MTSTVLMSFSGLVDNRGREEEARVNPAGPRPVADLRPMEIDLTSIDAAASKARIVEKRSMPDKIQPMRTGMSHPTKARPVSASPSIAPRPPMPKLDMGVVATSMRSGEQQQGEARMRPISARRHMTTGANIFMHHEAAAQRKQAGQVADAVSLKVQRVLVPERPQTARPSSQRRPDTGGGRPQRPSTSRPDTRVHVASRPPSARTTSGATPRPSTANSRMSAGAVDADGSESARALSLVTARPGSARVPYTKKPISHTPTVPPPATIGEKLTAEFWPEYAAAHERERAKTKERRAAAEPAEKLVRAFKVGLDPPSTAVYGPKRPISPVQWSRLEVAKAMNENHGAARGAKQAAAGGLRRPMTARARIQSNGGGSDTSEGESGGAFTARKLQRRVMVAKSQLRPSIQRSDADVQLPVSTDTAGKYLVPAEEVLGTFITQQGSSQIGPQLEEHWQEALRFPIFRREPKEKKPPRDKWAHLYESNVQDVLAALPVACDGRLHLETGMKRIIERKQEGMEERIKSRLQREKPKIRRSSASDIIEQQVATGMGMQKQKQDRDARRLQVLARKKEAEEHYRAKAQDSLDAKAKAASLRSPSANDENKTRDFRSVLLLVTLGYHASIMWESVMKAREVKREEQELISAGRVILKNLQKMMSNKYRKAQTGALDILKNLLSKHIRNWRRKRMDKMVDMIKSLFQSMAHGKKLLLAVKRFRRKIIIVQTRIRRFVGIAKHRRDLLKLQWQVYDEKRIADFEAGRAREMHRLKTKLAAKIDHSTRSHMRKLQIRISAASSHVDHEGATAMAGLLDACKHEINDTRSRYCHHFLPKENQKITKILDSVRDKKIEGWFVVNRRNYFQDYWTYMKDVAVWREMQESQTSLRAAAQELIDRMPQETKQLRGLLQDAVHVDVPQPPPFGLVIPPNELRALMGDAIEECESIAKKKAGMLLQTSLNTLIREAHTVNFKKNKIGRMTELYQDSLQGSRRTSTSASPGGSILKSVKGQLKGASSDEIKASDNDETQADGQLTSPPQSRKSSSAGLAAGSEVPWLNQVKTLSPEALQALNSGLESEFGSENVQVT